MASWEINVQTKTMTRLNKNDAVDFIERDGETWIVWPVLAVCIDSDRFYLNPDKANMKCKAAFEKVMDREEKAVLAYSNGTRITPSGTEYVEIWSNDNNVKAYVDRKLLKSVFGEKLSYKIISNRDPVFLYDDNYEHLRGFILPYLMES